MPQLASVKECAGCSACAAICPKICISMVESHEGFYIPEINDSLCISCGLCETVCPQLRIISSDRKPISVLAAWSNDDRSRRKSSSGAAFFEIAARFIETGGVVFGAINDAGTIKHCSADTLEGLERMRGSKYVQSWIGGCYKEVKLLLGDGKKVLFSGTPCQIAGLKSFIPDDKDANLFTVDLICHGVPPAKTYKHYLDWLSKKFQKNCTYDYLFRTANGWGVDPLLRIGGENKILRDKEASYMELYKKSAIFNECCYNCHYANTSREGDLAVGDFWGIGASYSFDQDISGGCSLVLVNTRKGESLIEETGRRLFTEQRSLDEAMVVNTNLSSPSFRPRWRNAVFRVIEKRGIERAYLLFILVPSLLQRAYKKIHHRLHLIKLQYAKSKRHYPFP